MKLTISIAQMRVARSDPGTNIKKAAEYIAEAVKKNSDMVCFPEMWTTGFDWENNQRILDSHESVIEAIASLARENKIWINGSTLGRSPDGRCVNKSILFDKDGIKRGEYCKIHLFSMLHEDAHVAAGDRLCLAEASWGLTGLTVCYDIRFPEVFRKYALAGAKMVLSPMAFPVSRLVHWKTLSRARAIEDQLFIVGANQVGSEDFGSDGKVTYAGHSVIIDPWGEVVAEGSPDKEELLTATVDMDMVDSVRNEMRVLKDCRPDLYKL